MLFGRDSNKNIGILHVLFGRDSIGHAMRTFALANPGLHEIDTPAKAVLLLRTTPSTCTWCRIELERMVVLKKRLVDKELDKRKPSPKVLPAT